MSRGKTKKQGTKQTKSVQKEEKAAETKGDKLNGEYIGTIHEAPAFVIDNRHIFGGYRINYDTPRKIFRTLFMMHNESVNIWTHLFAAVAVLAVIAYAMMHINPYVTVGASNNSTMISEQVKQHLDSFDNHTFIQEITQGAEEKIELLKHNLKEAYHDFLNATRNRLHQTDLTITELKQTLAERFQSTILNIVEMKEEFETHGVSDIIEMVKHVGDNSSVISNFKKDLSAVTDKFMELADSKHVDFLDPTHSPNPQFVSRWPVFVFLWSATICLLCSAIFHLFYPMSGKVNKIFSRFDYAGINILISGSAFPPIYYGMYCNLNLAVFYLSLIAVIATAVFITSLFEWIHTEGNKIYKALLFGGFGVFLIVPVSHMLINEYLGNWGDQFTFIHSVPLVAGVGVSYLFGLYVYTVQCPERHKPGQFDLCGHSHQIWHLFVVVGIIFTYMLALQTFEQRKLNICPNVKHF